MNTRILKRNRKKKFYTGVLKINFLSDLPKKLYDASISFLDKIPMNRFKVKTKMFKNISCVNRGHSHVQTVAVDDSGYQGSSRSPALCDREKIKQNK